VQRRRYEPWPPELSDRIVVDNVGDPAGHVARIVAELPVTRSAHAPGECGIEG